MDSELVSINDVEDKGSLILDYKITKWLRLEGTFGGYLIQPPHSHNSTRFIHLYIYIYMTKASLLQSQKTDFLNSDRIYQTSGKEQ